MSETTNPKKDLEALRDAGVLLAYQKRWVEDQTDVKVIEKSRRIGISWSEASDDALTSAAQSGDDVWYIGYNKEMALEFIGDCANWARHYQLAAEPFEEFLFRDQTPDGDKDILAYRIYFASGFTVVALSSRPTNLRGKQGIVVIDEAAFHPDLKGLIKAAMALLIWGGKVRIISTHNGEDNEFNELIKDIRAGRFPYSLHRVTLDDALADGLYRRICEVLGREWSPEAEEKWRNELITSYGEHADEELFCIPSKGGGIYFTSVLVESCMSKDIPVLRWRCEDNFELLPDSVRQKTCQDWIDDNLTPLLDDLDEERLHWFGEDFARNLNLTVFMPLTQQKNLDLRAPFVVELSNVPFRQQEQVLFFICDRLPNFRGGAMDARGNGQYLAEVAMQRYGADRILRVMLTREIYREAMPKYKVRFEEKTILLPADSEMLDDHRAVRREKGVPMISDVQRPGTENRRHGDSAVAGMLAVYAVEHVESGPVEYETVATRDSLKGLAGRGAW